MATKATAVTKKDKYNFSDAEVDYRAGAMSVNAIATKHGIPEPTLRREAKKRGWIKGLSSTKRAMVQDAMSGADLTNRLTNDEVRQNQLSAAQQDVEDMNCGLSVARACMRSLLAMVASAEGPRDIKTIGEANKVAVETVRKIRGLDELPSDPGEDPVATLIAAINGTALPVTK
jgi:transposase-like protein